MKFFRINKSFSDVQDLVLHLPELTEYETTILQDNRNVISKIETREGTFVVKDFRGMYLFNRLAYSLFRKSKAIRSYENSERLNRLGIATPVPVAWMDYYSFGILSRSIFINTYYPYRTLDQFLRENRGSSEATRPSLLHDLAAFALKLHRSGVYHDDFSVGNIFVIPTENRFDFALIDLNRMRFGPIPYKTALASFKKIQLESKDLELLIGHYARLSKASANDSLTAVYRLRKNASLLRTVRKKVKRYTLGLVERLITSS